MHILACQVYLQHGGHASWNIFKYNEYIVSSLRWNRGLPWTIQAIFYICNNADQRNHAYRTRGDFLRTYAELESWRAPVVCLDQNNWGTPFRLG